MTRRRTAVVSVAVVATAGLAGGAYAASQSGPHRQKIAPCASQRAVINDAARRLHVTPGRLTDALKQALVDQIKAAAKAGRLPQKVANAIERQIEHSPGLPFGLGVPFGPGPLAAGPIGVQVPAPPGLPGPRSIKVRPGRWSIGGPGPLPLPPGALGLPPGPFVPAAILTSAARYLGLTDVQLTKQLRGGKSLAQIAQARGKTKSGLERAIKTGVAAQLTRAAKSGHLPRRLEQRLLDAITGQLNQLVSRKGGFALAIAPAPVHVQVRAGGPPGCLAGAIGIAPPALRRTFIAPVRP